MYASLNLPSGTYSINIGDGTLTSPLSILLNPPPLPTTTTRCSNTPPPPGGAGQSGRALPGNKGGDSSFTGLTTAKGGGYGGVEGDLRPGGPGGSGGGGGGYGGYAGGISSQLSSTSQDGIGFGNAGGAANNLYNGGGGGAGMAGNNLGVGGDGKNTWSQWVPVALLGTGGYLAGGGGASGDGRGNIPGGAGGMLFVSS